MITIKGRLRPFSHEPGSQCLIPGTSYLVEAFPALLRIREFGGATIKEFPLVIEGPLKQFTVIQDLERGCVTVFSEQYSMHVLPNLDIVDSKHPALPPLENQERLSLGSHKKMEMDAIRRRRDFHALFPFWFRLGTLLKLRPRKGDDRGGMFSLLSACRDARDAHRPEAILPAFEKLFLAGFGPLLVPRAVDEEIQGILPPDTPSIDDSPLYLLTEGAALIRSLFFLASGGEISILPNLPPEFFAGRMTGLLCPSGILDLEWTKKTIRQLHFQAQEEGSVTFHFPPDMVSCRLRLHPDDKGRVFACGDSLVIKSGSLYLLDRFQK